MDVIYPQGDTFNECQHIVRITTAFLRSLGFIIHVRKLILIPTQLMIYASFGIDTVQMTLQITEEKADKIVTLCTALLSNTNPTIQEVAQVIGNLVAAFSAVPYGQLYYKELEKCKIKALSHSAGNFYSYLVLTDKALCELRWWIDNIGTIKRPIHPPDIDLIIHSDAGKWDGAPQKEKNPAGGRFLYDESNLPINIQEFSLMSYCTKYFFNHVRFKSDNSTAITYINYMGVLSLKTGIT